jgi:hypothetical protein
LFPASLAGFVLGKAGSGEMELGQEIALWKVRNHSYRGVNPAYELNELTLATSSGELANGIRERVKRREANVPGGLGKVTNLNFFDAKNH